MIRSIFLYLDRFYLMQNQGLKSLWDIGLDLFREAIANDSLIRKSILRDVLALIRKDR
jgi:cullin-4